MHPWGLYLRTEEHNKIQLLIVSKDGTETYMEPLTAAEDLVNSLRIDYSLYRGSVYQLDRHPLFKPKLNLSMLEYWDYVSKAQMCVDHLAEIDPAAHFFLRNKMDAELKTEDDGSASFLLYSGRRIQMNNILLYGDGMHCYLQTVPSRRKDLQFLKTMVQ